MVRNATEPTAIKFLGYSGDAVDLKDYGFDHPVVYDLSSLRIANQKLPLMYNHRTVVGETTKVNNTKQVVRGEAVVTEKNGAAKRISNANFKMEASMGLDVSKSVIEFQKNGFNLNGQTFTGPHYIIKNALLDEMTVTEEGRDSMTKVHRLSRMELSKIKGTVTKKKTPVTEHNLNININRPTPKKKVRNNQPEPEPTRKTLSYAEVRRLENRYPEHAELILDGVDKGWSLKRIENAVKLARAEDGLPQVPKLNNANGEGFDELEARLVATLCKDPEKTLEKHYGEEVRDHILNGNGSLGMKELLVEGASRLGGRYNGFSDVDSLVDFVGRANSGRIQNTGFSTFSMPNLFRRVTEIVIEEAWTVQDFFAQEKCFVTSHNDFKQVDRIRPSGGTMWEGLDANGRVKHGSFGEENRYKARLDTKAQMLGFNREMIENDDMGAISEILDLMVEGALIVPDVKLVNRMLQDQGDYFKNAVNDFTGNASFALSETSLDSAYLNARKQTINKGRVSWVNQISDRWALVVPLELEKTAWELVRQQRLISPTGANRQGDQNYWFGKLDIWTFNQLSNTSITKKAKSDIWFLWPQERKYAPWAISYLRGRKRPVVRVLDAPVDMLGFVVVGYFDVNVNDREPEAVIRMRPTGFGS